MFPPPPPPCEKLKAEREQDITGHRKNKNCMNFSGGSPKGDDPTIARVLMAKDEDEEPVSLIVIKLILTS